MPEKPPKKILFVCTGNSARSQMAEALARSLGFEAYSAGTQPAKRIHPLAQEVMEELGLTLEGQYPKRFELSWARRMDLVITVCGGAREACVFLPGEIPQIHWDLEDPAAFEGSEEEKRAVFRRTRDHLKTLISSLAFSSSKQGSDGKG